MGSLAISFSGKCIRFLNIDSSGKVSLAHEITTDYDFCDSNLVNEANHNVITEISHMITEVLKTSAVEAKNVSLSIGPGQVFINTLPVDFSESQNSIKSNILWDLSNYFPESYKDFKINYYKLVTPAPQDNVHHTLLIAVKKSILNFYGKILEESNLNINVFDIEPSAVKRFIDGLSTDSTSDYLLIGLANGRIDISINRGEDIIMYRYVFINEDNFLRRLERELNSLESVSRFDSLSDIYVYGEYSSEEVKDFLSSKYDEKNVTLLNPFKETNILEGARMEEEHINSGHKYASLFGLALKGLG